jgi:hypothetical protein
VGVSVATARRIAAAALVALASAGYAAASVSKDVAPFAYQYRFTSVTVTGTFTQGEATATTNLRLSRAKVGNLYWYGKRGYGEGASTVVLHVAGTYTYAGLENPACNGTFKVDETKWARPGYGSLVVTNARNAVVTRPTISVGVGEFVFASTYPARGGGCENKSPYYYGGTGVRPLSALGRPSFTISDRRKLDFGDGTALEWTTRAMIKRLVYKQIDCKKNPFC